MCRRQPQQSMRSRHRRLKTTRHGGDSNAACGATISLDLVYFNRKDEVVTEKPASAARCFPRPPSRPRRNRRRGGDYGIAWETRRPVFQNSAECGQSPRTDGTARRKRQRTRANLCQTPVLGRSPPKSCAWFTEVEKPAQRPRGTAVGNRADWPMGPGDTITALVAGYEPSGA